MKKHLISVLLAASLLLTTACGGKPSPRTSSSQNASSFVRSGAKSQEEINAEKLAAFQAEERVELGMPDFGYLELPKSWTVLQQNEDGIQNLLFEPLDKSMWITMTVYHGKKDIVDAEIADIQKRWAAEGAESPEVTENVLDGRPVSYLKAYFPDYDTHGLAFVFQGHDHKVYVIEADVPTWAMIPVVELIQNSYHLMPKDAADDAYLLDMRLKRIGTPEYGYISVPAAWGEPDTDSSDGTYSYAVAGAYDEILLIYSNNFNLGLSEIATNLTEEYLTKPNFSKRDTTIAGVKGILTTFEEDDGDDDSTAMWLFIHNGTLHYIDLSVPTADLDVWVAHVESSFSFAS